MRTITTRPTPPRPPGGLQTTGTGYILDLETSILDPDGAGGHRLRPDPDRIADTAWHMYDTRDRAEQAFDALGR